MIGGKNGIDAELKFKNEQLIMIGCIYHIINVQNSLREFFPNF